MNKNIIFVIIGLLIFGGSVFSYYQIEVFDEKNISDTKASISDSITNRLELSDRRISSIALAYEGFYRGSNMVEENEFKEFSDLILSENPLIKDVSIHQDGLVTQWFLNPNLVGMPSTSTSQSFLSKNNDDALLFLFNVKDFDDLKILLLVDASKLIHEDSIFSTNYKLNIINSDTGEIIYSNQFVDELNSKNVVFTDSELNNGIETTFQSTLVPYGNEKNLVFKIQLWTTLFEDYDDYYQMTIPIGGFVLAIIVTLLLVRSEKMRIEIAEKTDSLVKSEKLASIGELSARLAHDLRNPLSVIKNDVEILHEKKILPENEFARLSRAIGRMSHQIDHVLQFIKSKPLQPIENSIVVMINSVLTTLHIPKNVSITLPKNDAKVKVDRQQFEVVISNLILNSIQAVDENGSIDIRIRENQNHVTTEIQDSGEGIPSENIDKIFDPLFTTKQKGTGLGLASCKNIVEKHGGKIEVNTNPTVFSIILPKN